LALVIVALIAPDLHLSIQLFIKQKRFVH